MMAALRTDFEAPSFESLLARLGSDGRRRVETLAPDAARAAAAAASHWDFTAPAQAVDAILARGDGEARHRLRRGLIAHWARELPERLAALDLPPEVLALVPGALERLALHLAADDGPYDPDFWAKDVRFVLALTVPCGAQVVDLAARIGPGEVVRHVLAGRGLGAAAAYVAARGWGDWLQIHTESRWLEDFNEAGWDRCWLRVAALLRRMPKMRGVIGASWFYDPPLCEISPRLAYLQRRPVENGAFLVHQGPDPLSTERCTATSPSRRDLVAKGLYTPRSWILAWPREGLLRWADRQAG
jgi:hypothetical protein